MTNLVLLLILFRVDPFVSVTQVSLNLKLSNEKNNNRKLLQVCDKFVFIPSQKQFTSMWWWWYFEFDYKRPFKKLVKYDFLTSRAQRSQMVNCWSLWYQRDNLRCNVVKRDIFGLYGSRYYFRRIYIRGRRLTQRYTNKEFIYYRLYMHQVVKIY